MPSEIYHPESQDHLCGHEGVCAYEIACVYVCVILSVWACMCIWFQVHGCDHVLQNLK